MIKRIWMTGIVICMMLGLSGCRLFPEEAQVDDTLRIVHYTPPKHQVVKVERGDLDSSETVNLEYENEEEREYYLKYAGQANSWGEEIQCYVMVGDVVKKGQLLAEAPCEELEQQVSDYQKQAEAIQLDIDYNKKLLKIAKDEEKESYQASIEDDKAQLSVLSLRIQECQEKIKDYRIYADMDGQVSAVLDVYMTGYDPSRPFLRIKSLEGYFTGIVTGGNCKLSEGDIVTAEAAGTTVEMKVDRIGNADELDESGEAEESDGDDASVILYLTAEGEFETGDRARLTLNSEKVENVLYVPQKAVVVEEEKAYVQILGEDGYPRAKEIQVEDLIGGYYVIKAGLEEGDEIINE
ncbi:MAG: efflux RND transporter periplasmic adaptor subunit [Lachnospiraceae bacterium]